jgi:hypothetical protein
MPSSCPFGVGGGRKEEDEEGGASTQRDPEFFSGKC